jgi:hypothetical protein
MKEAEESMITLVTPLLSDKSLTRVRFVFEHLSNTQMLDAFFLPNGPHKADRLRMIEALDSLQF